MLWVCLAGRVVARRQTGRARECFYRLRGGRGRVKARMWRDCRRKGAGARQLIGFGGDSALLLGRNTVRYYVFLAVGMDPGSGLGSIYRVRWLNSPTNVRKSQPDGCSAGTGVPISVSPYSY